jgi:hypothetical protein
LRLDRHLLFVIRLFSGVSSFSGTTGIGPDEVTHAVDHALVIVDMAPDDDPPKVLVIGPRTDGQLIEVVMLTLANDRQLIIHAMALRPTFHDLLPEGDI